MEREILDFFAVVFACLHFLFYMDTKYICTWSKCLSVYYVVGMLVAVIPPYKSKDTIDIILILSVRLCYAGPMSSFITHIEGPFDAISGTVMVVVFFNYSFSLHDLLRWI